MPESRMDGGEGSDTDHKCRAAWVNGSKKLFFHAYPSLGFGCMLWFRSMRTDLDGSPGRVPASLEIYIHTFTTQYPTHEEQNTYNNIQNCLRKMIQSTHEC
jgi:hypothetical protein